MAPKPRPAANLRKVKRVSIKRRVSKVERGLLAHVPPPGCSFDEWWRALPAILKAEDMRLVVKAIATAVRRNRAVVLLMGAHPIKCGLTPLLAEMLRRGWISTIAMNGAAAIHDFEIACFGHTSEDVEAGLTDGSFGMVKETAQGIFSALKKHKGARVGFGRALGEGIIRRKGAVQELSLLATARECGRVATVHVAVGTDIIHQHPEADGALMGAASMEDFRLLAGQLPDLADGGVVINLGSAVLMPEVFLKALTVARNLGSPVRHFTAVNFDMIQHYRSNVNVVGRPTRTGGKGYSITGHHEILLPMLFAALQEELGGKS